MIDINQKLKELQPYVINIRFPDGVSVIDIEIKEGWNLPNSKYIGREPVPKSKNFYMLYPLVDGVGVNELLAYVETIIKLNIEREKKFELLTIKIKELERLFSISSLKKCESLEFVIPEIQEVSDALRLADIPLRVEEDEVVEVKAPEVKSEPSAKPVDRVIKVNNEIVELPPKKGEKIILEEFEEVPIICKCGPEDVCPVCVDTKM